MSVADTFVPLSPAEEALKRTVQRMNAFNAWLETMDSKELACYRQLVATKDQAAIEQAYPGCEHALFGLDLYIVNNGGAKL